MHDQPDLALVGGLVADVRTGGLRRDAVTISGARISAVGPHAFGSARETIDLAGRIVVPGYIEPHGHAILANPVAYAGAMLARGTTTAVLDALPLMLLAHPDRLAELLAHLSTLPVTLRWLIRLHPQSFAPDDGRFGLERLRTLWRQPFAAGVGEVTRWFDVLRGDPDLTAAIRAAREDGRRVEGHAAGASYERLAGLAAAGFTSCHEAVTADEVRDRLRAGLAAMLRHSSIRPDLPALLAAVTPEDVEAGRVMLTADGPTPAFIAERGYLDHLIGLVMAAGFPPAAALRMGTLNPAGYYGMDDRGEIAEGKRADINVIADLARPTPSLVIAGGRIVARDGALVAPLPTPDWGAAMEPAHLPRLPARILGAAPEQPVVIRMVNDVITEAAGPEVPPGALRAVLLDRRGRWVTRAWLVGFAGRLGGLATTISSGFDVVVLGQNPDDMAQALARLAGFGGGLVVTDGGRETFALPLELGAFSLQPWDAVVDANRRFNTLMQERGYRFADPLFSLLFLTFDSLPWMRLTSKGVWDVRARRVLAPSTPL